MVRDENADDGSREFKLVKLIDMRGNGLADGKVILGLVYCQKLVLFLQQACGIVRRGDQGAS